MRLFALRQAGVFHMIKRRKDSMKHRICSLLLALAMLCSLLPTATLAAEPADAPATVAFSVETRTIDGNDLIAPTTVELQDGDTVYTLLDRVAQEHNLAVEGADSGYVTRIGDFSAYGHGSESGWMVSLNNDRDTWPLPALQDGDTVRFCYTYLTYGYDIDLIDKVDQLSALVEEASAYEGENEDAVYEALEEAAEKLAKIDAYDSNKDYLTALGTMIFGPGSEASKLDTLILKLQTTLAGNAYVPVKSAEIKIRNLDGTDATELVAGRTYRAEIVFTPENPTDRGSGWKIGTMLGLDAEIAADGTLKICDYDADNFLHMLILQYAHPDGTSAGVFAQNFNNFKAPQTDADIVAVAAYRLNWTAIQGDNASSYSVTKNLTLPETLTVAGKSVTIDWQSDSSAVTVLNGTGYVDTTRAASATLTATLHCGDETATCTFPLYIASTDDAAARQKAQLSAIGTLADKIAADYADDSKQTAAGSQLSAQEWVVLDMAAYAAWKPDATAKTSDAARQLYLNSAISSLEDTTVYSPLQTNAKAEIILPAIGVDPTKLYKVNNSTPISAPAQMLEQLKTATPDHYDAPWILLSELNGSLTLPEETRASLVETLQNNQSDSGLYFYSYNDQNSDDVDTTATVIAALAPLYDLDATAKRVVDKAVTGLSAVQDANTGSFGNANADAMVIIGLAALGVNPDTDPRFVKQGHSLLDGLLSYKTDDNDGFRYSTGDAQADPLATEQGFRALVAAARTMTSGAAYNVYDWNGTTLAPGQQTGEKPTPSTPGGDQDKTDITVYFTMKSDTNYWISRKAVTVKENATVGDVFTKAIAGTGITAVGLENGYISSISNGSKTLTARENGPNTGWMYKVNGVLPNVGLNSYHVEKDDEILWFYTLDWTKEDGVSGVSGTTVTKPEVTNGQYQDVTSAAWYYDAVRYVTDAGLMDGIGESLFDPTGTVRRATVVTTLYRMAGAPAVTAASPYTDVTAGQWYTNAVIWASENGVVTGYPDGTFDPTAPVTREQTALMLCRYARLTGRSTAAQADLSRFDDAAAVAGYAASAVRWANADGLMTGRTEALLVPKGTTNRAEYAALLQRYSTAAVPTAASTLTDEVAALVAAQTPNPTVASIGGEWAVVGIARSSAAMPANYAETYYQNLTNVLTAQNGTLSTTRLTDYARVILALSAIGRNPADAAGYNLLAPLGDEDAVTRQGVNGVIYALIALDSGNYTLPEGSSASRDGYVSKLLSLQLDDGGWALTGSAADPDLTAMALQALAPYRSANTQVQRAVERGIAALSALQNSSGGFTAWGAEGSESTAQAMIALNALGLKMDDSRFVKNGVTLLDNLLRYYTPGKGFSHTLGGEADAMATEQALLALVAYDRTVSGEASLYSMK